MLAISAVLTICSVSFVGSTSAYFFRKPIASAAPWHKEEQTKKKILSRVHGACGRSATVWDLFGTRNANCGHELAIDGSKC